MEAKGAESLLDKDDIKWGVTRKRTDRKKATNFTLMITFIRDVGEDRAKYAAKTGHWPTVKYEAAKKALQGVLHEMDATWHNPVLRQNLREKARVLIKNTGLLNSLLAIKEDVELVFSGEDGEERLMGQWIGRNVSQYWLEPAKMKDERQRAKVGKYWIPSSKHWKIGDSIPEIDDMDVKREIVDLKNTIVQQQSQINELKDELAALKAELEEKRGFGLIRQARESSLFLFLMTQSVQHFTLCLRQESCRG